MLELHDVFRARSHASSMGLKYDKPKPAEASETGLACFIYATLTSISFSKPLYSKRFMGTSMCGSVM